MYQKDFILRQIEMLSLILLKLTKQLEISHNENDVLEANDELFKSSKIDLNSLIIFSKNELKAYLTEQNVSIDSYIDLAKYLNKLANIFNKNNPALSKTYTATANKLVKIAEEETGNAFLSL